MTPLFLVPLDALGRPARPPVLEPFPPPPDQVDAADAIAAGRERARGQGVEWIDRRAGSAE